MILSEGTTKTLRIYHQNVALNVNGTSTPHASYICYASRLVWMERFRMGHELRLPSTY